MFHWNELTVSDSKHNVYEFMKKIVIKKNKMSKGYAA